jgi:hypothetical protein
MIVYEASLKQKILIHNRKDIKKSLLGKPGQTFHYPH